MTDRLTGTVKWFNEGKGFGFIESSGKDYFVHFSAIEGTGYRTLQEGAKVSFRTAKGVKGIQAEEVKVFND